MGFHYGVADSFYVFLMKPSRSCNITLLIPNNDVAVRRSWAPTFLCGLLSLTLCLCWLCWQKQKAQCDGSTCVTQTSPDVTTHRHRTVHTRKSVQSEEQNRRRYKMSRQHKHPPAIMTDTECCIHYAKQPVPLLSLFFSPPTAITHKWITARPLSGGCWNAF